MQLAKSERLQLSCDVLNALEVPDGLHTEIMGWTRFSFERNQRTEDLKRVVADLPPILQNKLMQFLYADSLVNIGVVGFISSIDPSFLMQLWQDVEHLPFYKGETLVHWHEKADRCIIVTEGICEVHVDRDELLPKFDSETRLAAFSSAGDSNRKNDTMLTLQLRKGHFVGELALLGDTDWGSSSLIAFPGTDIRITASCNVMCMVRYVCVQGLCLAELVLLLCVSVPACLRTFRVCMAYDGHAHTSPNRAPYIRRAHTGYSLRRLPTARANALGLHPAKGCSLRGEPTEYKCAVELRACA